MLAFRCSHSGKYFPSDYVKEWGRKYGIGLGSHPVSEILDTNYAIPPAIPENDASKSMHPLGVTRVQVDLVDVSEEEYNANKAIIAMDDPQMIERSHLIRNHQLTKSPKLRSILS